MRVILKDDSMQKAYKYKAGVRICFHYHSFLILHLAKEIFNHPYKYYSKPKGKSNLSAHVYHSDIRAVSVMTPPADGNELAAELIENKDDKTQRVELLLFLFRSMPAVTDSLHKADRAKQIEIYNLFLELCKNRKSLVAYFVKVARLNTFELQGRCPDDNDDEADRPFDAGNHLGSQTGRRWIVAIFSAIIQFGMYIKDVPDWQQNMIAFTNHVKNNIKKDALKIEEKEEWSPAMERCWRDALLVASQGFKVDPPLSGELPTET
jgi:hypothetical protein